MAIFPSPQPEADSGLARSSSSLGHVDLATATEGFGGGGLEMGWDRTVAGMCPSPPTKVSGWKLVTRSN